MIKKYWQQALSLGYSATARNLYWVFTGNATSIVLATISTLLIARSLSLAEFGIYIALFTFANLLSDLGEGGFGAALSSFIPRLLLENKKSEVINLTTTVYRLELVVGGILLAVSTLTAPFLAHTLFGGTQVVNVWISILTFAALLLFNFAVFILSAHKQFKEFASINMFYGIVRLFLLFLLLIFSKMNITWILLVYLIAPTLTWVYTFVYVGLMYYRGKYEQNQVKKLFKFSGYLSVQKIFVALSSRLDVLMIIPLSNAAEAGVYGAASRMSQVYPFMVSSFAQVLAPKFAEFKDSSSAKMFFRKVLLVISIMLLSLGAFYVSAPYFIPILLPTYREAIPVFQALLIAMTGFIAATPLTSFLIYTLKKTYLMAIFSGIQLFVIFGANLLLIPQYGRFGPVIGIGLGNLAVFLLALGATVYYFRKHI